MTKADLQSPTDLGANAFIFGIQYKRQENAVSGSVALGSILAAVTLPVLVTLLASPR